MKQSSQELKKFSSQIRFALDNYKPHGIDKDSLNAVLICGIGGSGIAGRIVKDYFQDKFSLPVNTVSGYLLPRYVGKNTLVVIWSYSGNHEEALAAYDIAWERKCHIIVISSGGSLSEKAAADEITFYPVETGLSSGMALGYALTYQLLIIFEMLGVHKKPDLLKIAAGLDNSDDYLKHAVEIASNFSRNPPYKFIVVCDSFFEGVSTRFCQQVNQAAGREAFINMLPEGGYHVLESYQKKQNSNFIFLNSRLGSQLNSRFAKVKQLLERNGMKPMELLVSDASLKDLYHITHVLDWLALQIAGTSQSTGTSQTAGAGQTTGDEEATTVGGQPAISGQTGGDGRTTSTVSGQPGGDGQATGSGTSQTTGTGRATGSAPQNAGTVQTAGGN